MTASTVGLGIGDDELVDRKHAEELLVAVDDEELVGLARELVAPTEITQHDLQRDVGAHRDVLEIHQRADHVVVEGHRRPKLLALLDRQAREDVVHHLLREVGRQIGDLLGVERLGRGDELVGVHRRDERLADGVRDLEQDFAVARGAHEVPDVEPLVERQRLEDVRDVGGVQPVELLLQCRLALLVDGALGELGGFVARLACLLILYQALDQPVLAHQRGDVGERLLHARARLGQLGRLVVEEVGHRVRRAGLGVTARTPRF